MNLSLHVSLYEFIPQSSKAFTYVGKNDVNFLSFSSLSLWYISFSLLSASIGNDGFVIFFR